MFILLISSHLFAKDKGELFIAGGNQGLGLLYKYKTIQVKGQYYFKYQEYDFLKFYYHHRPSISCFKIINSKSDRTIQHSFVKYFGMTYRMNFNKQKYFLPGTYNFGNFGISFPFGIQFEPLNSNKLKIAIDYSIEFEHDNFNVKRYLWTTNMNNLNIYLLYKIR